MKCNTCDEYIEQCFCHRADIWGWLARRPLWQQYLIGMSFWLAVLVLMTLAASAASAQTTTVPRNAAQLSFVPPSKNTDGTDIPSACTTAPCGALSLHRIEYGTCNSGAFGSKQGEITVAMPATTALVSGLVVQVYCFRAFTRNDYGAESPASNVATKTIVPPTPASPLLSVGGTAYEIRPNSSGVLVARRVGLIPPGSLCSGEGVWIEDVEYHRVDRRVVDVVNWPSTERLTDAWAVCGVES